MASKLGVKVANRKDGGLCTCKGFHDANQSFSVFVDNILQGHPNTGL